MVTDQHVIEFVQGYTQGAQWAEVDEEGNALDHLTLAEETQAVLEAEARDFLTANAPDLTAAAQCDGYDMTRAGHDFWLTRCGHGCGYWDRDELPGDLSERLTEAAKLTGGRYLYVGDDDLIYQG